MGDSIGKNKQSPVLITCIQAGPVYYLGRGYISFWSWFCRSCTLSHWDMWFSRSRQCLCVVLWLFSSHCHLFCHGASCFIYLYRASCVSASGLRRVHMWGFRKWCHHLLLGSLGWTSYFLCSMTILHHIMVLKSHEKNQGVWLLCLSQKHILLVLVGFEPMPVFPQGATALTTRPPPQTL